MESSVPGVYGAGDIVKFPLFLADNEHANVQHWQMASMHGGLNVSTCHWQGLAWDWVKIHNFYN